MTLNELFCALASGKKIIPKRWSKEFKYIYFNKEKDTILDQDNQVIPVSHIFPNYFFDYNSYELYKEHLHITHCWIDTEKNCYNPDPKLAKRPTTYCPECGEQLIIPAQNMK